MGNSPRYLASPSARGFTLLASVIGREYTEGMQRIASWSALYLRLALRALVRPRLAVDLLRLAWSFRARDWYRRPPFLTIPPRDYMQWRMFTAYSDEQAVPPVDGGARRWACDRNQTARHRAGLRRYRYRPARSQSARGRAGPLARGRSRRHHDVLAAAGGEAERSAAHHARGAGGGRDAHELFPWLG